MSTTSPLAYGQLSTWRSLESMPRHRWQEGNFRRTWPVPVGNTAAQVMAAVGRLTRAHESLRTTFQVSSAGQPVQVVHSDIQLPVDVLSLDEVTEEQADMVALELVSRPFDFDPEPGWRAKLLVSHGLPEYLCLANAHLVADKWALDALESEFHAALAATDDDFPPAPAPREVAALQRSAAWQSRRDGSRDYWHRLFRDAPPTLFPAPRPGAESGRVQAVFRSYGLRAASESAAQRTSTSPQSVLQALLELALSEILGTDRFLISLMSSNRSDPAVHRLVSSMNQLIPMVAEVRPEHTLGEHIASTHWAGIRAHRHACYDTDVVNDLSAELGKSLEYDYWYNFMAPGGRLAEPGTMPADKLEWTPPSRITGPRFDVKIGGGAELRVIIRVDNDVFGAEAVRFVLNVFTIGARLAATDPGRRLDAVLDECRQTAFGE